MPSWLCILIGLAVGIQDLLAQPPAGPYDKWDYCGKDVKCKDPNQKHTVCERNHVCTPVKDCMERITDKFRDMMVKLHNEKRNFVALGKHTKNNVKPAKNMRALSYDYSLEYTIRCHINRCTGTEHDKCRGTKRWVYASQNLCGHTIWDDKKSLDDNIESLSTLCVDLWFNESYYNGADFTQILQSYDTLNVAEGKTGHFTAMVWAVTSHLGCHFSRDTIEKEHEEMGGAKGSYRGLYSFVGCNYGVGGNNEGRPMYQIGKACTRCPRGVECNHDYPGLCGQIKYVADLQGGGFIRSFKSSKTVIWIVAAGVGALVILIVAGFLIYKFVISGDYD